MPNTPVSPIDNAALQAAGGKAAIWIQQKGAAAFGGIFKFTCWSVIHARVRVRADMAIQPSLDMVVYMAANAAGMAATTALGDNHV